MYALPHDNFKNDPEGSTKLSIWLNLIITVTFTIGLVGAILWSYVVTRNFFVDMDQMGWHVGKFQLVSNFLATIFQFGQNPAAWWVLYYWNDSVSVWNEYNRRMNDLVTRGTAGRIVAFNLAKKERFTASLNAFRPALLPVIAWSILAFVDGGTNVIEVAKLGATGMRATIYNFVAVSSVIYEEVVGWTLIVIVSTIAALGGVDLKGWFAGMTKYMAPQPVTRSPVTIPFSKPASQPSSYRQPQPQSSRYAAPRSNNVPINNPILTPASSLSTPLRPAPKPRQVPITNSVEPTYHPIADSSSYNQREMFDTDSL